MKKLIFFSIAIVLQAAAVSGCAPASTPNPPTSPPRIDAGTHYNPDIHTLVNARAYRNPNSTHLLGVIHK